MEKIIRVLDLHLFDGGAAGAAAGGDGAAAPQTGVTPDDAGQDGRITDTAPSEGQVAAAQSDPTPDASDPQAEFEDMISSKYKDQFNQRVKQIVDRRFKTANQQLQQYQSVDPLLDILKTKYGESDTAKLIQAIESDESFYEEAALREGLSVAQYKEMQQLKLKNQQFERAQQEAEALTQRNQKMAQWREQEMAAKRFYPSLDLASEINPDTHPETAQRFTDLLSKGIDVRTCYEIIHRDEINQGLLTQAAQSVRSNTAKSLQSRQNRPPENGTSSPATVESNVALSTKKEREEWSRRALRGEKVTFT